MRHLIFSLFSATLALSGMASAQTNPVVVELFTSQGCSSCPPADAVLGELAGRDDVIALALHVDYWDYIGWKDTFATPAFTDRQHAYAFAAGARTVYTPQIVVGGVDDVIGSDPGGISRLVASHQKQVPEVALSLERSGDAVVISATGAANPSGMLEVQLIRYRPEAVVAIKRGENAGRSITYRNIVTSVTVVDRWDGQGSYSRRVSVPGDDPVVVLLQRPQAGPIVAAARVR